MRSAAMMEAQLRRALVAPGVRIRTTQMNGDMLAFVEWDGHAAEVVVDPMRGGLIECVIHELIHFRYAKWLNQWGRMEEVIVCALERPITERVNADPSRVRWWRNAIAKKLDGEGE